MIYPWAVVYREFPTEALIVGAPFLGVIVIGYVYEWYSGSLDWVRSSVNTSVKGTGPGNLSELARTDPQVLEEQGLAHG